MMKDTVKIKIKASDRENEYEISFPTVGQYRNIEIQKDLISRGMYSNMALSNLQSVQNAIEVIDIEAILTTLCPKLIADLVTPFEKLGIEDYKQILKPYRELILPMIKKVEETMKL